jgi:hypothetical protein
MTSAGFPFIVSTTGFLVSVTWENKGLVVPQKVGQLNLFKDTEARPGLTILPSEFAEMRKELRPLESARLARVSSQIFCRATALESLLVHLN